MTVQELINKLQTFNPNNKIIVEDNHGEYNHVSKDDIDYEMMVEEEGHLHYATEIVQEDLQTEKMIVIRL